MEKNVCSEQPTVKEGVSSASVTRARIAKTRRRKI